MKDAVKARKRLTSFQKIILGFAGVILLGALLLMLPFASASGESTPFSKTLFTATSAVCVTGLVVFDTASYWSGFGQAVLLILIQIGGLGVVTVAASFALLAGRRISLSQRSTMQEAIAAPKIGGIVRFTGFVIRTSFLIELIGALTMLPVFLRDYGARGIWLAVFTSVSAFCNAGFDLMGTTKAPFASLTGYSAQPVINIAVMLLIVVGGIGFLTWEDVKTNRFHLRRYRMQSKVALTTSGILILVPAIFFFVNDFRALPTGSRIFQSLFQSVTTRTAGFNTADLNGMSGAGRALMIPLMLIGGSPGSTAGGLKTTTFAVLLASAIAVFRRREDTHFFGRRLNAGVPKTAAAILMLYLTLFFLGAVCISVAEGQPMDICLFETASAVGTVGLSLGLTPTLGLFSRTVLIILMFLGRVGGLTLIYAALSGRRNTASKLPQEAITVG